MLSFSPRILMTFAFLVLPAALVIVGIARSGFTL